MSQYPFPPSEYLLEQGQIQENNHFFVNGSGIFDGKVVDCSFEVGYTHDCQIVIICYMTQENGFDVFFVQDNSTNKRFKRLRPKSSVECERFEGIDERTGFTINTTKCVCIQPEFFPNGTPSIFIGQEFTISIDNEHWNFESLKEDAQSSFEVFGMREFSGTAINYISSISGSVYLETTVKMDAIEYPNQTTGKLIISDEIMPSGWVKADMADMICALLSLSLGRDIRRKSELIISETSITDTTQRMFKSNGGNTTNPLIYKEYPSIADSNVIEFLKQALTTIDELQISQDAIQSYSKAIQHHMEFRLSGQRMVDQARLITTSVEELLAQWYTFSGVKLKKRKERNGKLRKPYFAEKLEDFFKSNTHRTNLDYKKHIEPRLNRFKDTRNEVVHQGKFVATTPEGEVEEYFNMLMILPLMVFTIFGYTGDYRELGM